MSSMWIFICINMLIVYLESVVGYSTLPNNLIRGQLLLLSSFDSDKSFMISNSPVWMDIFLDTAAFRGSYHVGLFIKREIHVWQLPK